MEMHEVRRSASVLGMFWCMDEMKYLPKCSRLVISGYKVYYLSSNLFRSEESVWGGFGD